MPRSGDRASHASGSAATTVNRRVALYAFTEQRVAMLSSVLSSPVQLLARFCWHRRVAANREDVDMRRIEPIKDPEVLPRDATHVRAPGRELRFEVDPAGQNVRGGDRGDSCKHGPRCDGSWSQPDTRPRADETDAEPWHARHDSPRYRSVPERAQCPSIIGVTRTPSAWRLPVQPPPSQRSHSSAPIPAGRTSVRIQRRIAALVSASRISSSPASPMQAAVCKAMNAVCVGPAVKTREARAGKGPERAGSDGAFGRGGGRAGPGTSPGGRSRAARMEPHPVLEAKRGGSPTKLASLCRSSPSEPGSSQ
jgi:hypothetical protein